MEAKSSVAKEKIALVSWRGSRSARSVLLLQMAADEERRAGQAARIKELRENVRDPDTNRPLTQENLARALFVATRTVQNWEAGKGIDPENAKRLSDYLLSQGIAWATVDYIENGIAERQHGPAPDLSHGHTLMEIREQLQAIEARFDQLATRMAQQAATDRQALEAQLSQLSNKLDYAVAERTDSDAAIVQQIAALETTIRDSLRRQRPA